MEDEIAPTGDTKAPSNAAISNDTTGRSCNDEYKIDIDHQVWGASNVKGRTPRIPQVPNPMRNNHSQKQILPQWFKPGFISIGPYCYKYKNLGDAQQLKSKHAEKFIDESEQIKEDLYRKIKEKTPEWRKWYDNQAIGKIKDNQLATIFFLDGCFLLNFIKEDGFTNFGLTNHEMTCIKQDLFLLENQLPYEVLKLLFKDSPLKRWMEEKIRDFVASQVPFPQGIGAIEVNPSPSHLLHYLQGILLDKPKKRSSQPQEQGEDENRGGRRRAHWRSCRTVQELKKVGIHFKPSPTSYLTDISFNPHFGTTGCLKLPTISMNASTMIMFLNLIAFESSNSTSNLGVISYLCFLDTLIDRWDDVKELQAAGILRNFVGEQRDVAQFFNIVCSKLVPDPSAYRDVIQEIESHVDRHYKSTLRTWYVQCKQKYFSSPWSLIALIAAIIGLSLTGIQAFTSLFPR